jgi:hypothetical protein
MNTGLDRIELTGLARIGGGFLAWPENPAVRYLRSGFVWLAAVLMVGFGAWALLSGNAGNIAKGQPAAQLAKVTAPEPAQSPAIDAAQDGPLFRIPTTPEEAFTATEMAPVEGLKIASQSWRRGGLGSKALVTFTLRNSNDYAVRDIEISCAFARRDGSHLTDRKRMIHDTVNMRSQKTFARMHIGFVNINADQAKCALVTASRA